MQQELKELKELKVQQELKDNHLKQQDQQVLKELKELQVQQDLHQIEG